MGGYESTRECSACRSMACTRDDDCPTCETCGKRGHVQCSAGRPDRVRPQKILDAVIADLRRRDEKGVRTYGDSLRVNSPNDALTYAYEEALDLAMYLRQEIERRTVAGRATPPPPEKGGA